MSLIKYLVGLGIVNERYEKIPGAEIRPVRSFSGCHVILKSVVVVYLVVVYLSM